MEHTSPQMLSQARRQANRLLVRLIERRRELDKPAFAAHDLEEGRRRADRAIAALRQFIEAIDEGGPPPGELTEKP